ncbi:MAG: ketopantoate reductase family protein [Candidatus Thorarchaeota archaeon]
MRIVVMGAGSIGNLYGGFLALRYPGSVTLVGRDPLVESVQERGLFVEGVMGDHQVSVQVTDDPATIESADIVMITTKTYDTLSAARSVKHLIDNGAYVVVLQNGIGTEIALAETMKTTRVIRATTCMGAFMKAPGKVYVTGKGITEIGSRYSDNMEMVYELADMLQDAGFDVRTSKNIEGVVWTKTIVNCGINPIGALTGMTNGEVHSNLILRDLVIRLVEETVAVANALGIELTTDDPVRYTLGTAKATAANINSMLQDLRLRKRTEIDAITGAIIQMARELGIETPISESVYALIKAIESKYLGDGTLPDEAITMAVDELLSTITQH